MNLLDLSVKISCEDEASSKIESLSGTSTALMTGLGTVIGNVFTQAMQVVSESIDDAISRVDTLNQFPKVMESLGYSAEEAEASISALSEGIEGLPTALDDIVSNTQLFAATLGDLDEATDTAIAVNDLFIAAGSSSEDASYAVQLYNKALASGSMQSETWLAITSRAPGQFKQLAETMLGTGSTASDLYDALSDGTITMEDLNDAIIDLDQNGGEGFDSFAEQAQAATGGIETSMENAKTAVVRNLANIIDALNENGEIADFFDDVKQVVNEVGGAIEDAVPKIKEFFDEIGGHASEIATAAAAIGGFVGTMKLFWAIMEAGSLLNFIKNLNIAKAAMTAWKTATELASAAQAAFNLIMEANSLVLVISIIVALVAAFITLYNTNEDFRNAVNNAWETIKSVVVPIIEDLVTFFTETLPQGIQDLIEWFQNLPENVSNAIEDMKTKVSEWVSNLIENATEVGTGFVDTVVQFFNDLPGNIGYALGSAIGSVIAWVLEMKDNAIEAGSQFLENVGQFFDELPGNLKTWFTNAVNNAITWASDMKKNATDAASNFISNVKSYLSTLPSKIKTWFDNTVAKAKSFASDMKEKAKEAGNNFKDKLVEIIEELPDKMLSIGKDIVKGIWNGINSYWDWLSDKVSSFVDGFVSGIKDSLGIASPSKVFAEIGNYTIEGFAEGLEKAWANVENFADEKTGEFITTFSAQPALATPLEATAAVNAYDASSASEAESAKLDAIYEILSEIRAAIPSEVKLNSKVVARVMRGDYA